ncbi:hypothetical protein AJ80_01473 [Polytolypa hystricis UAMH7299]|uniref:Zn(2)-C6 fungal-type domain-containing protein n=1 Tax=Polytolypa hystricis (strain UAMH7299) TaxID=1447883 RepID=A0A2B7Z0P4_POLH7|nr:hypothetical protein AJ80_01473 [Polytolypa hystricis UAMH7299]
MSTPPDFGQDEPFLPLDFFDAYLHPVASEQVDEHTQLTTALPDTYPSGEIDLTEPQVFDNYYPGHGVIPMLQEPTGQRGLNVFGNYPEGDIISTAQVQMGEMNVIPQPGSFQDGIFGTFEFEGFLNAPMTDSPNWNAAVECDYYGSSEHVAMPTVHQSPLSVLSQYPPAINMGENPYEPLYPHMDVFSSSLRSGRLVDASVTVPQPLLLAEGDGNTSSQSMISHEIPATSPMPLGPSSPHPSTQKRKLCGPSNDVCLPPIKRGGRRGPMRAIERKVRKEMRVKGACIICRVRKKKCDGEVPCGHCLKNFKTKIIKNPCTKANFLDMVESKPCYAFSGLYESIFLKQYDHKTLVTHFAAAYLFSCEGFLLEIKTSHFFPVTVLSSWAPVTAPFFFDPEFVKALDEQGFDALPQLLPIIAKGPNVLTKKFTFGLRQDAPQHIIASHQLHFCASIRHKLTLINMRDERKRLCRSPFYESARLLIWLLARQCEILLFRYLQNSVNHLDSILSTEDLGYIADSLLRTMDSLTPNLDACAIRINLGKEITLDQEMLQQLQDRQKRLRMALFVYASITCSRLPAFSDFWTNLEKSPLKFTRKEFKNILVDLDSFDSGVKAKAYQINSHVERVMSRIKVLQELDPSLDSSESADALPDFMKRLQNGDIDKNLHQYDMESMDGLLTATASGSFAEIRAWKFFLVAKIDWVKAFSNLSSPTMKFGHSDIELFLLANSLRYRMQIVKLLEGSKQSVVESGLSATTFIEEFLVSAESAATNETETGTNSRKAQQKALLKLRDGLRWRELEELTGEEIYLLGSPFKSDRAENKIRSFDVPFIVSNGSEANFNHLKRLLLTSQSWLKETCLRLKGLVQLFKAAVEVDKTDKDATLVLAREIQERVFSVFGNRAFLDQVLGRRSEYHARVLVSRRLGKDPDALETLLREVSAVREMLDNDATQDLGTEDQKEQEEELEYEYPADEELEDEELDDEELEELSRSTRVLLETYLAL